MSGISARGSRKGAEDAQKVSLRGAIPCGDALRSPGFPAKATRRVARPLLGFPPEAPT